MVDVKGMVDVVEVKVGIDLGVVIGGLWYRGSGGMMLSVAPDRWQE